MKCNEQIGPGKLYPCFAEMYLEGPGVSVGFTAPADVYHALSGLTEGCNRNVAIDGTAGTFTISQDGTYKFDGVASLYPSAGMKIHFALFVNDVEIPKIETTLDFKNNQDTNTFAGTGLVELKKGDVVDVRGMVDTVPVTLTVEHFNIAMILVG